MPNDEWFALHEQVQASRREAAVVAARFEAFVEEQRALNHGIKKTIYGEKGDNGLQGDVRDLKHFRTEREADEAKSWDVRLMLYTTGAGIVGAIVTALILLLI